jgi:hypothetical protein
MKKKAEIKAMEEEEREEQRIEKEFNEKTEALSKPDIDDFATEMKTLKSESKKVAADSSQDVEPSNKSEAKKALSDKNDEKSDSSEE